MIQVWLLDSDNFFINKSIMVEELSENMTDTPLMVGYVRPRWTGLEWVEGATSEQIQEWIDSQPKPKPLPRTNEELEEENNLLRAQVKALNESVEFHEELIAEMATKLYA